MNWTFLLPLYETPSGPNPILQHLAESATHALMRDPDDALGYHLYEGQIADLVADWQLKPFSYGCFSDTAPDELSVVNRGKTMFSFFDGRLVDDAPSRVLLTRMLALNSAGTAKPGSNYMHLVHSRVMSGLHGKFTAMMAELGAQPSFIFRSQKMSFSAWLICYGGVYYFLASNNEILGDQIEERIMQLNTPLKETFFQQRVEIPTDSTLVLRSVYMISKFRERMRDFSDKSSRRLYIVNYFRRYLQRQCVRGA